VSDWSDKVDAEGELWRAIVGRPGWVMEPRHYGDPTDSRGPAASVGSTVVHWEPGGDSGPWRWSNRYASGATTTAHEAVMRAAP
jgi:hypothetical protein